MVKHAQLITLFVYQLWQHHGCRAMHKYLAAKGKHGKTVRRETGVLGHAAGKVNSCARMERMLCTSNEETHTHTATFSYQMANS